MDEWQTPSLSGGAAGSSVIERFVRGYVGGAFVLPFVCLGLLLLGWPLHEQFSAPTALVLLAVPAVIAVRAMQTMPVGSEFSYVRVHVAPRLSDGLRGIVAAICLLAFWAIMAFVTVGFLAMIWSGIRGIF
jgi:hypothetical protein